MIIVSGQIYVKWGKREAFIQQSVGAILAARQTDGCHDFAISPDPIEPERINIFEKWESQEALFAFRESGPTADLASLIESIHVSEHQLANTISPTS